MPKHLIGMPLEHHPVEIHIQLDPEVDPEHTGDPSRGAGKLAWDRDLCTTLYSLTRLQSRQAAEDWWKRIHLTILFSDHILQHGDSVTKPWTQHSHFISFKVNVQTCKFVLFSLQPQNVTLCPPKQRCYVKWIKNYFAFQRWKELRDCIGMKLNSKLAILLLDCLVKMYVHVRPFVGGPWQSDSR